MKLNNNTFVRTFVRARGGNLATNPYNTRFLDRNNHKFYSFKL